MSRCAGRHYVIHEQNALAGESCESRRAKSAANIPPSLIGRQVRLPLQVAAANERPFGKPDLQMVRDTSSYRFSRIRTLPDPLQPVHWNGHNKLRLLDKWQFR